MDHDLPLYSADFLIENSASGHFVHQGFSEADSDILFAPRDAWLAKLAQGWRLHAPIPDDLPPPHAKFSIMLWRPAMPSS